MTKRILASSHQPFPFLTVLMLSNQCLTPPPSPVLKIKAVMGEGGGRYTVDDAMTVPATFCHPKKKQK